MPLPKDETKIKLWKENMSKKLKEVWKDEDFKKRQSEAHKGFVKSKETIDKQRNKMIGQRRKNKKIGHIQTEEHIINSNLWRNDKDKVTKAIEKRKETNLKKYGTTYGKKHTNESKKKISDSIKKGQASGRIKISENFKREDVVEKRKKSLLEGIKNGKYKKFSNTKPELETKDILNKYGIEFEHQKIVNGKIYDFYLPDYNLLIEVDGNYWHSKGKCDIDILNKSLKNRRKGDRIKNKIALKKGYRLFRVWEDELYKLENLIKNEFIGLECLGITEYNYNYYLNIA